ncbi:MAG: DUF2298 domain-containing protein, partial [Halobacteriaceae archaeon]
MWTFINGDLRPHMTSSPFLVLTAAIVFSYYHTSEVNVRRRKVILFGVLPPVVGLLGVINTWEFPVSIGLVFLALSMAKADPGTVGIGNWNFVFDRYHLGIQNISGRIQRELRRICMATLISMMIGVISLVWMFPYYLFHTATSKGIGLLPPGSEFVPFLLFFGGFLSLFILYLSQSIRRRCTWQLVQGKQAIGLSFGAVLMLIILITLGPVVALLGILLGVTWTIQRSDLDFEGILILSGLGLLLVNEVLYAKVYPFDPNAPRWNTAYKIFHSTWILWGVGGGVVTVGVLSRSYDRLKETIDPRAYGFVSTRLRDLAIPAMMILLVITVVIGAMVFPTF